MNHRIVTRLLIPLTLAGMLLTGCGDAPQGGRAQSNPIVIENQNPGTQDWLLTKVDTVLSTEGPGNQPHYLRSRKIEGYTSRTSYAAGDTVTLFVSMDPSGDFTVDFYRMGYYQGNGGRHMRSDGPLPGITQPTPEDGQRNLREAAWKPSHSFVVPDDWLSGVYLGKLTSLVDSTQAYVVFVVRDNRRADFNFQVSDMTWQAYNRWPAWRSMYDFRGNPWNTSGGDIVSFDRPYGFYFNLLPSDPNYLTNGSGEFLLWEHPLAFWMEEQGYDVTYTSNIDTHEDPDGLLRTKGFISVSHDEYWTRRMFNNVTRARNEGVSLLFLSGNAMDGEVFLTTSLDGRPNRIMGRTKEFTDEQNLMGASSYGVGLGDWIVKNADHWIYEGTGVQEGDRIEDLVGWEYHGPPLRDDSTLVVLAEGMLNQKRPEWPQDARHAATIYTAPKGNFVFNAGTCWWSMKLSTPPGFRNPPRLDFTENDPRVQQITRNLMDRIVQSNHL